MNQVTDIIFFWFPVLLTFPMVEHLKAIIYHMVPKGDCCYIINGKEEEVNHTVLPGTISQIVIKYLLTVTTPKNMLNFDVK